MTAVSLPPEIWALVIPYLRNPTPKPLSAPPRALIRQPDLCSLSRVSSLFHSLCAPLIYSWTVVTDQFGLLMFNPSTLSKRQLPSRIHTLHIEYCAKGLEAPYHIILQLGSAAWASIGPSRKEQRRRILAECVQEVEEIRMGLLWVARNKALYRPSTVPTSIGQSTSHHSEPIRQTIPVRMTDAFSRFDELLSFLPSFRHFCIRDVAGVLNIPRNTCASHVTPIRYSRCQHFTAGPGELILPWGAPMTWCSDEPMSTAWQSLRNRICDAMSDITSIRADRTDGRTRAKTDTADLTIYASTGVREIRTSEEEMVSGYAGMARTPEREPLSEADQRKKAEEVGIVFQGILRDESHVADVVRRRPSQDTPTCPACGSGRPL
ncbi:uncharacterized protein MKK02DRAFT_41676 [Dioszegia hungarica]|uniref:Uncharacterized protein n=1 Tax=Dioszegia hungarica TaxID=4972 RepID=A0AA38H0G0_9TREE|nr:uncharacterized protein MKK02DRAFT_41676 [Dioszegia hungarica]KAI9632033.1 hypothetical protein MKK02DRAFT_41676 [Dioszegia hungarica]